MKILVTGCAGFIGFHVTQRFLEEGYEVVGVDNMNDYYDPALKFSRLRELGIDPGSVSEENPSVRNGNGLTFIQGDITDEETLGIFLGSERFDVVCHLAAQAGVRYSITNPKAYIDSNITGFLNILEYCRANPPAKLVYASSSSIYGANASIPYRESDKTDSPVSLYAATKKSNELMAYSYSSLYGLNCIGLRFFTVYGPWGRPDMAPFLFTSAILEGRPIKVFNNGDMARDFTYIDDITEGIYRVCINEAKYPPAQATTSGAECRIYNIGNSAPVELEEFISTIETISGIKAEKEYMPMQQGEVARTWADTTLLEKDYGYHPSTPLKEGLSRFIAWYKEYYGV